MTTETIKINGFTAKVRSHRASVVLRDPNAINPVFVAVDPGTRITKSVLAQLAADHCPQATKATVNRYRCVAYMLRSVMKERSGSVNDCAKYALTDSGWACKSRERDATGIY